MKKNPGWYLKNVSYIFEGNLKNVSYIFEVAYAQKCKLQLAHAPPQ